MASFKQDYWDERYAVQDLVWGAAPNRFVAAAFETVAPTGRVLDLACGEGRNAIWLAARGWRVVALDFSRVAIERGRALAAREGVELEFVQADVTRYEPKPGAFEWVLVSYLQLPSADMRGVWPRAASALAPGAGLFGIGHARANLTDGFGGPSDRDVLWDPESLRTELAALGLEVEEAATVLRPVADAPRPAIDARIRARRPAAR